MADVVVVNKLDSADATSIERVLRDVAARQPAGGDRPGELAA